jgi:GNAT superfamily N-acetyltransferase
MIRIKKVAGEEWAEEIAALQKACLPHDEPVDTTEGDWWLAFDGDAPVAFACLKPSEGAPNTGYLARAGVLPSHRGMGLQKRLIRVRCAQARRYGWEWVRTDTRQNTPSANNLIACGFRIFDPPAVWGVTDTIYWRKAA